MKFCIKVVGLNRSYSANTQQSENDYISQKSEYLRFAPMIVLKFYFAFLIDIIENIIHKSLLRHKNSGQ